MTKLFAIPVALAALCIIGMASANPASAQEAPKCETLTLTVADPGFKPVGLRRPFIEKDKDGKAVTWFSVEVQQQESEARGNGADGTVMTAEKCRPGVVRYNLRAVKSDDGQFHNTELPMPETAKSVKIRSCSSATKQCYEGVFNGDFGKRVTLVAGATAGNSPVKLSTSYKD